MKWEWLPFAELTSKQLYDVLQLRELVFHLEQRCFYRDIDDVDLQAKHLLGYQKDVLIGYLRVSLKNNEIVMSRILVARALRNKGVGRAMVRKTLERLVEDYPDFAIVISAQVTALEFYRQLGFAIEGDVYDDAGIPHIKMIYQTEAIVVSP